MTLTKVLPQDLLNDIVPAWQDKPLVWNSKYYGSDASWNFWFFPWSSLVTTPEVYRWTTPPATPLIGWLWVDTSNALNVQKQRDGTARVEVKPLQYDNTLFVDLGYGNNTTWLRERADRPFLTVAAAYAASQDGDRIVLRPWVYNIWNISILWNLNVYCEPWVVINTGRFNVIQQDLKFNFIWYADILCSDLFVLWWVDFYLEYNNFKPIAATRLVTNGTWSNTIDKLKILVRTRWKNIGATTAVNLLVNLNNYLVWQDITFTNLIVDLYLNDLYWVWWFNIANAVDWAIINLEYNTADFRWQASWRVFQLDNANSGIWSRVMNNIKYNVTWQRWYTNISSTNAYHNIFNAATVSWWMYNTVWNLYCKEYIWSAAYINAIQMNTGNILYIWWDYHESNSAVLYWLDQKNTTGSLVWESFTTYNNVKIAKAKAAPIAGWASPSITGVIFIVSEWASYICDSLEHISEQYIIWWVDNFSSFTWLPNTSPSVIEFFWTKFKTNNTLSWTLPTQMFYLDHGNVWIDIWAVTFKFHNWVYFESTSWTELIWWAWWNWPTQCSIEFYDDYTSNIPFSLWGNIDVVRYMYNGITEINTPWTYTILDSDKDIYADLSLGSYNLVLPLASKNQWREISAKATALDPTNTITFQGAIGNEIDLATTFTFWAITNLPNYTIKSALNKWRVK